MPEEQEFQRRLPSVYRRVADISADDIRVCIIARVIDVQENVAVLDDGTGKINASFGNDISQETGALVRVFGRVINSEGGFELQGEVMQAVEGLDIDLYRRVEEKWGGV